MVQIRWSSWSNSTKEICEVLTHIVLNQLKDPLASYVDLAGERKAPGSINMVPSAPLVFHPRVTLLAGLLAESTLSPYTAVSQFLDVCNTISMKTLNQQDSILSHVSTVVESDHRTTWLRLIMCSHLRTCANCALVRAAQSSSLDIESDCLGATLELAIR